jgi:integrase
MIVIIDESQRYILFTALCTGAESSVSMTCWHCNPSLYIIPHFGKYRLDDLTTTIVQQFYNKLLHPPSGKKPLAPKTIHCIHGVLHQALDQAVNAGVLQSNPTSACKLPKVRKKEVVPLDDSQIKSFLERIKDHPHEYLYKITLFTGLREGEILGLTWDCVNMKRGILTVKQQLTREKQKGGKYYFSSTKNDKPRTLTISPSVVRLFKFQKQKQLLMEASATEWEKTNLVFTNAKGGILSYRTVYDCFKRIVKGMGCPEMRFHDLRHQYAVIAIKNGDDIKTIQSNLGHATAAFTLDVYGHVTDDLKRNSADRMESYLQALKNS